MESRSPNATGLDALPFELLKRIAMFSTAGTALALSQCNKKLHSACFDPLIFRNIIQNPKGTSSALEDSWDISFLPSSTPASVIARYAVADSRARSWKYFPRRDRSSSSYELCSDAHLKWAPHLAMLGHPFIQSLDLQAYVGGMQNLSLRDSRQVLHLLINALFSNPASWNSRDIHVFFESLCGLVEDDASSLHPLDLVMSMILWQVLADLGVERPVITLPLMDRMLMARSKDSAPPPFMGGEMDPTTFHVASMSQKAFIEDGDWCGYYSYDTLLMNPPHIDPAMESVKLRLHDTNSSELSSEIINETSSSNAHSLHSISGNGKDSVGNFRLSGQLFSDGRMPMTKIYDQGIHWDWDTCVTPWGIMGFWGQSDSTYGWVWLWKREWST